MGSVEDIAQKGKSLFNRDNVRPDVIQVEVDLFREEQGRELLLAVQELGENTYFSLHQLFNMHQEITC